MTNSEKSYEQTAERLLSHKHGVKPQTREFTTNLLRLSDKFTELENKVLKHKLGYYGLTYNGLSFLEIRYSSLGDELSQILSVLASPRDNLDTYTEAESEEPLNDAKQLETAIHSWGDLESTINRIERSHARIGENLNSKRQERASKWIIAVSVVAVVISVTSLLI